MPSHFTSIIFIEKRITNLERKEKNDVGKKKQKGLFILPVLWSVSICQKDQLPALLLLLLLLLKVLELTFKMESFQ